MKYLAIDTSGKNLTVIIKNDDKLFTFFDKDCAVRHSVELMPRVEELAIKAGVALNEMDFFSCTLGAGSFTGIRIGVATIKAMCFAYKKPCLPITSFDTIAYNEKGERVLAVIDAKHDGFYVCGYDGGKVIFEPSYIMRDKLNEIKDGYKLLSFEQISGLDVQVVSTLDGYVLAIEEKYNEITFDLDKLEPLYVRKSQAEEGR
ncbi:MAG: tRNA (adenosine(37)-N6)-threonylcarbamoyltransferase complex dimerization subunit type 1 TsaB [Clostridia bacterium]|nr:tRNA (adenosine(37)-N6)-threonylcarbamoyltransferase complex dimerization subunit type 1 TsaB [Clostridia bacterium]